MASYKLNSHFLTILLSVFVMICLGFGRAQAQSVIVKGKIIVANKAGEVSTLEAEGYKVWYFWTKDAANDFVKKYRDYSQARKAEGVSSFTTEPGSKGEFSIPLPVGTCLLIYNTDSYEPLPIVQVTEKNAGNIVFRVINDNITLQETVVEARQKESVKINKGKTRGYGNKLTFSVAFEFPYEFCKSESRLFVSPAAIDCMTEDTVAFLKPFVVDGDEYHKIQNRRMLFDFKNVDPVAPHYKDSVKVTDDYKVPLTIKDGEPLSVRVPIEFTKPDPKRNYSCQGSAILEDYTHELLRMSDEFGSCNTSNPFKFLDFNLPGTDIELTREFYEPPTAGMHDVPRDLPVRFITGKAEMVQDSANIAIFDKLAKELKAYGDKIIRISIQGTSSPEGSLQKNEQLARQRAEFAMAQVRSRINTRKIQVPPATAMVYTWKDVADEIDKRMKAERDTINKQLLGYLGGKIRGLIESGKENSIFGEFRNDSVFNAILASMRVMKCSYTYQEEKVLSAEEAVDAYYHDERYARGGDRSFANGDYYNLIQNIKNPKDQKDVVFRAWEFVSMQPGHTYKPFAAYLANRIAMYNMEEENGDTTVLYPFLREEINGVDRKTTISFNDPTLWTVNRKELVANQAIMLLKKGYIDHATFWMDKLPDNMEIKKSLSLYRDMIETVLRWDDPDLSDAQKQHGKECIEHIMSLNPINKAILMTELKTELDYKEEDIIKAIDAVPDDDARKWYLMGELVANTAGTTADKEAMPSETTAFDDFGTGYVPMSEEEEDALMAKSQNEWKIWNQKREEYEKIKAERGGDASSSDVLADNGVARFLAYFQSSFDIRPAFKRFFAFEGNIESKVFKNFPYVPKDAPKYREKFKYLLAVRDAKKKAAAKKAAENGNAGTESGGDAAAPENVNSEESAGDAAGQDSNVEM